MVGSEGCRDTVQMGDGEATFSVTDSPGREPGLTLARGGCRAWQEPAQHEGANCKTHRVGSRLGGNGHLRDLGVRSLFRWDAGTVAGALLPRTSNWSSRGLRAQCPPAWGRVMRGQETAPSPLRSYRMSEK